MKNLTALHSYLKTKKDADKLNSLFENWNSELFKENFNFSNFITQNVSYELKGLVEKVIQEAHINTEIASELRSFLLNLQEKIKELPLVHIILPFAPSEKIVNIIHSWFYDNYKTIVLLDISIDKSIIGGSVISFKGQAIDYSLAARIEQIQQ